MATMKDIARETGLGIATISKYINGGHVLEKNRQAIDEAIQRLGYTVNEFARGLKTSRSRTIGVVIPELRNAFVTTIVTAMEDILRRSGYGVIICDCRTDAEQEREAVEFLLGKRVDGIVNMPVSADGAHLLPAIQREIPVVLIDRLIPDLRDKVSAVLVDNVGAAHAAVDVLVQAGHRDIGIILGPKNVFTSSQRLLGYNQCLIGHSLMPEETRIHYSDYTVEGGYGGLKSMLNDTPPTAVFVTNYEMTLGAMIAVNELGVNIPGELSLIGFDNLHLAEVVQPKLTIVTQPLEELGEALADILLTGLEGEEDMPVREITLSTGIARGNSVARP